ncbi:MAG: hypothetical protein U0J70_03860 [Atopobiaceae bacterium]|nr:hypothetical protein [Atopobiaceae bacterium]
MPRLKVALHYSIKSDGARRMRWTAVELRADFVLRAHELPVAGTWR